ncbi:MAG: hypothetical protein AB8C46_16330 [Burkholderiaceae bacterium]
MRFSLTAGAAALLCLALSACGGGGGSNTTGNDSSNNDNNNTPRVENPDAQATGVFDGYAGSLNFDKEGQGGDGGVGDGGDGDGGIGAGGSLGQFRGVEAVVFLENGDELGRTVVNSDSGLFTIKPGKSYQGGLLVEIRGRAGAQYYDEAKKAFVDFGPGLILKARTDRANRNIGVTPLTNAAAVYLDTNPGAGGVSIAEQIRAANELVSKEINARLPAEYAINDVLQLPIIIGPSSGQGSADDTPAGTYAVVLASLADAAASFNSTLSQPALSISESLARDLTDGKIDERQKNGDPVAPAGQESYAEAELDAQLNSAISRSENEIGEPNSPRNSNKTIALLDQELTSVREIVLVFDDSNIAGQGPLTSSGQAVTTATGGNPGSHISMDMTLFGGDLLAVGAIKENYTYSPSIEGALATVSVRVDVQELSTGSSSWNLAVEQNDTLYFSVRSINFSGNWTTAAINNLAQQDFETFGTPSATSPDFSESGAPIKFGFVVSNVIAGGQTTNGSGPFSIRHAVDNLDLTITKQ